MRVPTRRSAFAPLTSEARTTPARASRSRRLAPFLATRKGTAEGGTGTSSSAKSSISSALATPSAEPPTTTTLVMPPAASASLAPEGFAAGVSIWKTPVVALTWLMWRPFLPMTRPSKALGTSNSTRQPVSRRSRRACSASLSACSRRRSLWCLRWTSNMRQALCTARSVPSTSTEGRTRSMRAVKRPERETTSARMAEAPCSSCVRSHLCMASAKRYSCFTQAGGCDGIPAAGRTFDASTMSSVPWSQPV
mmetsp:Transcript_27608/g.81172  ORF Transcript_27608/g.81172 Transcript_27608/m.81172 type:complete len:251 (-) Transcript_27608:367-1119(-)